MVNPSEGRRLFWKAGGIRGTGGGGTNLTSSKSVEKNHHWAEDKSPAPSGPTLLCIPLKNANRGGAVRICILVKEEFELFDK
mgnify:CR=1 FL=1